MQDRGGKNIKSECQKGKGVGRHEESRQEARLFGQCQTTGRGPAADLIIRSRRWEQDGAKRRDTRRALIEECADDLTGTQATWFRFQGAEQRVKRLDFQPPQEGSRANGGTRHEISPRHGTSVG